MGWVIVRDALCIGPWHHETERSHSHRRSPTDHDADHVLLRMIECVQGSAEIKLECEPAFDYGGLAADWEYTGAGYGEAVARSEGMDLAAAAGDRSAARVRGPAGAGADHAARGRGRVRRARLVRARAADELRGGARAAGADAALLAGVAQARHVPRPSVAHLPAAQRADAEGADLRAVGRADRRRHHVAAGGARRRPQLGLPLQLDPRLHLHAVGAVLARVRGGGQRLLLLRRRHGRGGGGAAPDHVRDRRRVQARGAGARAPLRATTTRGRCGSATAPTTRTSTTCGARCSTRSTCTPGRATSCPIACGRSSSARWRPRCRAGASPTGASGRCGATPSTSPPRS